jgi:hypothetical protein
MSWRRWYWTSILSLYPTSAFFGMSIVSTSNQSVHHTLSHFQSLIFRHFRPRYCTLVVKRYIDQRGAIVGIVDYSQIACNDGERDTRFHSINELHRLLPPPNLRTLAYRTRSMSAARPALKCPVRYRLRVLFGSFHIQREQSCGSRPGTWVLQLVQLFIVCSIVDHWRICRATRLHSIRCRGLQ